MTASDSGKKGEEAAGRYLTQKGYKIIARNFHSRFGEIDIICKKDDSLVFIEVKTRSNSSFGAPIESVTAGKLSKMVATAQIFMSKMKLGNDYSFDVVEVFEKDGRLEILHTRNVTL